jgi:hypothetical protein
METDRPIGAHGGGIPPGWDFPEARAAAEEGIDLWLLDTNLRKSVWERIRMSASAARLANLLRKAGQEAHGI